MSERSLPRQLFGQLATFIAVAETLSFRHAAEIMGRSQPAITTHIQQLEDYLGIALFVRTTRHVRLTAAGAELLERAKKILVETRRLMEDMRSQVGMMSGQVVASFSPTTAVSLTPRVLTAFVAKYPGIRVQLREDLGPEMVEAVSTAEADFGIGPYRIPEALSFRPLFDQEFFAIVRSDHPMARRGHARLTELADLDILCSSAGTTARTVVEEALRREGIPLKPRFEALQYPTLFTLAASGFGVAVMPLVNDSLLNGLDLRAVPFRGSRLFRTIGLITRRGESFSPPVDAFVHVLVQTIQHEGRDLGLEQTTRKGKRRKGRK
jgi:LysR family transcriptional regulator, carnitine catabolism transcriptional activator